MEKILSEKLFVFSCAGTLEKNLLDNQKLK